jgi:rhodanese-related sulfurtransferase
MKNDGGSSALQVSRHDVALPRSCQGQLADDHRRNGEPEHDDPVLERQRFDAQQRRERLYLTDRLEKIRRDKPIVLQCQGGARSSIAASVLRAGGFHDVMNLTGGIAGWQHAGLPVECETPATRLAA